MTLSLDSQPPPCHNPRYEISKPNHRSRVRISRWSNVQSQQKWPIHAKTGRTGQPRLCLPVPNPRILRSPCQQMDLGPHRRSACRLGNVGNQHSAIRRSRSKHHHHGTERLHQNELREPTGPGRHQRRRPLGLLWNRLDTTGPYGRGHLRPDTRIRLY